MADWVKLGWVERRFNSYVKSTSYTGYVPGSNNSFFTINIETR